MSQLLQLESNCSAERGPDIHHFISYLPAFCVCVLFFRFLFEARAVQVRTLSKVAPTARVVNVNWLYHSAAHFAVADPARFPLPNWTPPLPQARSDGTSKAYDSV